MPIHFDNPQPTTLEAVRAVQERIGLVLPDQYVALLTSVSNGGSVEPVIFKDDLDIGVVGFLGIGTEHYDLATRVAQHDGDLPEGLVPIADTEGGNLICAKVSGGDLGSIWFWNHELEVDAAHQVAGSLEEFVAGLGPYENTGVQPKVVSVWVDPEFLEEQKRLGNYRPPKPTSEN